MERLNYHHLLYFWVTAREGSIARAAAVLHLTQPTISSQVQSLERALGERLFERRGRGLELTEVGRLVRDYGDEIFALGRELKEAVRRQATGRPRRFTAGVTDVVPKLVAYRLLAPLLALAPPVRLDVSEDHHDRLLQRLATHELDVVLSDAPIGPSVRVRAFAHPLADTGVAFFAAPALARRLRRGFPRSLDGAPLLLPTEASQLRRSLDQWFEANSVRPVVVGQFDDSALMKEFGEAGAGCFAVPALVEAEVARRHRVARVGGTEAVRARFYALSVERRVRHPAVLALTASALTLPASPAARSPRGAPRAPRRTA